jgi:hypothetical protein
MHTGFWYRNTKKTDHSEDLDIAGWIILQLILKKYERRTSPWTHLTQSSDKRCAVVNMVMNSKFHKIRGLSWLADKLLSSQE